MNLNHKKLIGIILALALALTVAGYGGNRGTPEEQGFSYAVFFADTPGYIDAEGELHETPSPYMNAECLYVPALLFLKQ